MALTGMDALHQAQNGGNYPLSTKPRLEIVEQPKARGFRFRYDCEGQSHGGLPGENSEKNRKQKTYPTVRLVGYRGRARVMVSLISENDPVIPHAHSIVGKNTHDGRCTLEMGPETEMYAQFPNMGILHVTKKKVPEVLTRRLAQTLTMARRGYNSTDQNEMEDLTTEEREHIKSQAAQHAKTMNLSVVRLCFQAFLIDGQGKFTIPVEPVFSQKVYDSKAPSAGTLKICRLDRTHGSVKGGDDVFLLCDKVQKNDIEVLFYEERGDGSSNPVQPWTAKGRFGPNDVHHQYAVVFQTPPYYNLAVERPVNVLIALRRPSDNEMSEPKPFLYLPQEFDEERIGAKRKKKLQHFSNFFGDGGAGGLGSGMGGALGRSFFGANDMSFGSLLKDTGGSGGGGGGANYSAAGGDNTTMYNQMDFNRTPPYFDAPMSQPSYPSNPPSNQMPGYNQQGFEFQQPGYMPPNMQFNRPDFTYQQPQHQQQIGMEPFQQQQLPMSNPEYGIRGRGPEAGSGRASPSMIGMGGLEPKKEKMDPGYGDNVEMDNGSVSHRQPPVQRGEPRGKTLGIPMDTEREESGFQDFETLDSGLPDPIEGRTDNPAEVEARAAGQALVDRQQAAFAVCERMFNALLAWATTRDVRYLLAAQRSLTAVQNQQGDTALHLAIIHNHQDVVLQLLDVLPQLPPTETPVVDCLNNLKQSPLHLAVLTRQHKVIQYLLKANANPLVCDREGNTPLHLACRMGFMQGAVALLNRSNHINTEGCRIPEVNIRNSSGQTPVHLVAKSGHTQVLKQLANAKADIDVQDSRSGKTALHHAVENGDLPMTGYLVTEANCNVDCCDFSSNTPLHIASGLGKAAIVSLLIAGGADIGAENQEGESPQMYAEYRNHDDVAKLLREAADQSVGKSEDQLSSQMEAVSIKQEGDLRNLDFRARISLAILLDHNERWKQLCDLMKLSQYESGFATFSSPTKELLQMFEVCEGTIGQLRQYLVQMNGMDAVNIIDSAQTVPSGVRQPNTQQTMLDGGEGTGVQRSKTAPVFGAPRATMLDSGIDSQSASTEMSPHIVGTHHAHTTDHGMFGDDLATTQA